MLTLQRRVGESIDIGPARLTLCGYRKRELELLIVVGSEVKRTTLPQGRDIDFDIDGTNVVIGYKPDSFDHRYCATRFYIYIDAPRELVINRSEVADELRRQKNGQSIKGLAYVE